MTFERSSGHLLTCWWFFQSNQNHQMSLPLKNLLLCLVVILVNPAFAAGYRTWTEADSGRTVEAQPIEKKIEGDAILVLTREGKRFWLQTKDLIKKDQEFIKDWVPEVDHLSVRVVGSGKGYKVIEITAKSGGKPMKVVTKNLYRDPSKPHVLKIPAGQTKVYEVKVIRNYTCRAFAGNKVKRKMRFNELVDEESHDKKTGL